MSGYEIKDIQTCRVIADCETALVALWSRNLSSMAPQRFIWLYGKNPEGAPKTCVAVLPENNEMIGSGSIYPRMFDVGGVKVKGGIAVNFAIDKKYRVFGPALSLQRSVVEGIAEVGYSFVFAYPNKASRGVFTRAGYRVVGEAGNWVKLLDSEGKLSGYVKNKTLVKLIAAVVNRILEIQDRSRAAFVSNNEICETLDRADERFDALWENTEKNCRVLGTKSSSYLNWRYSDYPTGEFRYFCLFDGEKRDIKAFVVFTIRDNIATVMEMNAVEPKTTRRILLNFSLAMRMMKASSISISYLGNKQFVKEIEHINFIRRPYARTCMIFIDKAVPAETALLLSDEKSWFLFDAEMDL
ncbi:MAG TPA: hypothetical protein DEE98_01870 [Elusimicrobia bacterium]|nr:MAG: hypothetical protein A2278_05670 [Elusimicrobia bacterium RIFOXYA12_FULL_49_49]OGS09606.1 MAG: hypothetical protein A2204_00875 [Elusimicrobia bacterium RIFOXYA1_FULL_47_7]OGS11357.1 MAG: hypothetical protein A2386_07770 [Elusimicrobia bacterium RIFOXYB1_FULL_48_9]OGS15396.1 MAG: hypothetical protein A2251_07500 [Elusimicrobia bacterium RIFOXYA2_FULL_47_53]OGS26264.1 MAG: hypothetical protein A2339_01560 [Elusimicrobia bacterium RIFOXYB12_FULL_50_12]OGS30824.1 MAG: hypothetical protein